MSTPLSTPASTPALAPARPATQRPPWFRLSPRPRKTVLIVHVISSVALLGQVWVNAMLAVIAMRMPEQAHSAYLLMRSLVFVSAAPLSVAALASGVVLGLGTKWGVLRYWWVTAKLVLLVLTVLIGIVVQRQLLDHLLAVPSPGVRWANLAATGVQLGFLVLATVLSVFKPSRPLRPVRQAGSRTR